MSNPVPPQDGAYPPPAHGGYPAPGGGGYPAPGGGSYPAPAQPGYPAQDQPYYPGPAAQPSYPGQAQPSYSGQAQPSYSGQAQPSYSAPGQAQPPYPAPGQAHPPYPAPGQGQPPYPAPADGQPGFPPPGQQTFGAFPTEEKKGGGRRIIGRIGLAVLALIVVGGIRYALAGDGDEATEAKKGDCIAADKEITEGESAETSAKVVDCGSSDAKYTVVARVDGENDVESEACNKFFKQNEHFYVYASDAGGGYLLCLRPKA